MEDRYDGESVQSATKVLEYGIICDTNNDKRHPENTTFSVFTVHGKVGEGIFSKIKFGGSVFHCNVMFQ
jgi:hypothetical protein